MFKLNSTGTFEIPVEGGEIHSTTVDEIHLALEIWVFVEPNLHFKLPVKNSEPRTCTTVPPKSDPAEGRSIWTTGAL